MQLDRLNEKILDISSDGVIVSDRGFEVLVLKTLAALLIIGFQL